jgi:pimeloyl-ACP methyl ester carboxylesterase
VFADAETFAEVLEGSRSGVDVWLKGFLRVRGSIALALQLEGMLDRPGRPIELPVPKMVRAGELHTFYVEAGQGPTCILLHGLGATAASMLTTLLALAPRYHALGIQRAHLIGNSMGGRIALEAGMSFPERVDRLVLFAPAMAFRKLRQLAPVVRVLRPELGAVPLLVPRRSAHVLLTQIFSQPDRLPPSWYDAAVDEFFRVFSTHRGRIALFSSARQIYLDRPFGDDGFWERLAKLRPPALFLWGDRDILVPSKFARHVERCLPGARSIVLEDCGHVPQFELPELTHEHVLDFLDEAQ